MIRRYLPKSTEDLIRWYERYVAPASLLIAFILDNVIFRAINLWATTATLALYLLCAILGIFFLNLVETGRIRHPFVLKIAPFLPVVVQFAFGGMFSGFFVLYSQSATLTVSWLSIVILALLLIGNERFRLRYRHFSFQAGILFIALLGFLVFFVPLLLKRIGPEMFLISGTVSVVLIALYIKIMRRVMPELVEANLTRIARTIAVILVVFNVLYFTNAIPPLPLALKESGVYHRVTRVSGEYRVLAESVSWIREHSPLRKEFHLAPGESVYAFSSIFAPAGLGAVIYHEWQRYDEVQEKWITASTIRFPIVGGRDGGYRGYSLVNDPRAGKWRVNVLTEYGQVVGRISFTVVDVPALVELEEKVL